ncbi:MAG: ImmA/IrrE family metallo-endopeptidase [Gemmatimonadaceae bacterium]
MTDSLFLPFTPVGRARELRAIEVKSKLGVAEYDPVDPFQVLDGVPARLIGEDCLEQCSETTRKCLLADHSDTWSAVCYGCIGGAGEALILLNPTHHPNRQRVSLMEEIVHILLDHPPTELVFDGDGFWTRPFDSVMEKEAYSVGAACIIPYRTLFNWIRTEGADPRAMAQRFGVSTQYVEFRVRDAGLYRVYKKARAAS